MTRKNWLAFTLFALLAGSPAYSIDKAEWVQLRSKADSEWGNFQFESAIESLNSAVKALKANDANAGNCLRKLGLVYRDQGKYKESEDSLRRAVAVYEAAGSMFAGSQADCLTDLAAVLDKEGKGTEAAINFEKAANIIKENIGEESADAADNLMLQGRHYSSAGDWKHAEQCYRNALATFEKTLARDSTEIAWAASAVARAMLHTQPQAAEIEKLCTRAIDIYKDSSSSDMQDYAEALTVLSDYHKQNGKQHEAETLSKDNTAVYKKAAIEDGIKQLNEGSYDQAITSFKKALELDHTFITAKENLAAAYNDKAVAKMKSGSAGEAEPLLNSALEISKPAFGTNDARVQTELKNLAVLQQVQGNLQQAKESLTQILATQEKTSAVDQHDLADTLTRLGQVEAQLGLNQSAEHSKRAVEILAAAEQPATINTSDGIVQHPHRDTSGPEDPADYSSYMAALQKQIKGQWHPPKNDESIAVAVIFRVHHAGQVSHVRMDQSSGQDSIDKAAIEAVKSVNPLNALPSKSNNNADIVFNFDYNVKQRTSASSHTSSRHSSNPINTLQRFLPVGIPFLP